MKIWGLLRRYSILIFGLSGTGLLTGILLALFLAPTYRAEVVLATVSETNAFPGVEALGAQFGGVASLFGLSGAGESKVQENLAVLKSRVFTKMFISENELIPVFFAERFRRDGNNWELLAGEEQPTLEEAYTLFHEDIRHVAESSQTGLITIAIDWSDGETASRWANQLVNLANRELRRRAIEVGEKNIDFLNSELERTTVVGIQQAIFKLLEAQIQNIMIANVREEYAFRIIDPASTPDEDNPHSPNRPLIVIILFMIGSLLGFLTASILDFRRAESRAGND